MVIERNVAQIYPQNLASYTRNPYKYFVYILYLSFSQSELECIESNNNNQLNRSNWMAANSNIKNVQKGCAMSIYCVLFGLFSMERWSNAINWFQIWYEHLWKWSILSEFALHCRIIDTKNYDGLHRNHLNWTQLNGSMLLL